VPIRRAWSPIVLWTLLLGFASPAGAAVAIKGPYLIYPDDPACMTVLAQTDEVAAQVILAWGPDELVDEGEALLSAAGDRQYQYTICDLPPSERTHYSLTIDGEEHAGAFLAGPAEGSREVTIYGYGDTRTYPENHDAVATRMLDDVDLEPAARQTLTLHTGDWVSGGGNETSWDEQYFDRDQPNARALMRRMPVMGLRGNHESTDTLLRKYWPYRGLDPAFFGHSFDYGPVHVALVDQYEDFGPGSDQYLWLEEDLRTTAAPWKIVAFHQPAWSAGSHANDLNTQTELLPLLVEYDVAMTIAGHNHNYARAEVDGILHITCGGGGAPLYTADPDAEHVVTVAEVLHFVRIEVLFEKPYSTLVLTAIDVDGNELDGTSVTRRVCHQETCAGGDEDCDGEVDEPGATDCVLYYRDEDGDGYGVDGDGLCLCAPEAPFTAEADGDCDDGDPALQAEDHDGDGVSTCDGDCADLFPGIYPGADEQCRDGLDNDCDGLLDREDPECDPASMGYLPDEGARGCACEAAPRRATGPWGAAVLFALWGCRRLKRQGR